MNIVEIPMMQREAGLRTVDAAVPRSHNQAKINCLDVILPNCFVS